MLPLLWFRWDWLCPSLTLPRANFTNINKDPGLKTSFPLRVLFMFVIPLGFALGSKGDAFRAQRGKNPWVRFPSGNKKREHPLPFCDSVGIRTQGPQLRRLLLYPTELRNQHFLLSVCKWFAKRLQNYKKDWRYENSFSLFYQEGA